MSDETRNETEYRRNAAETVQLAQRAPTVADKSRLLALAEAWLDLADRARQVASRRIRRPANVHPLVREKLDPYTEPNSDPSSGRASD
jgi:hypothetical protein